MNKILSQGLAALLRRQDDGSSSSQSSTDSTISTGSDTGDKIVQLIADPFKSEFQTKAVWVALGTNIGITLGIALVFSILRPRHTLVYAPKTKLADEKHAPPPIDKGLLSWIKPITTTREDVIAEKAGLDAAVFLRFTRMLRNMFTILSILGCGILIPVNVLGRSKSESHGLSEFAVLTPQTLSGNLLWSQVICSYAFNVIVAYFLWYNYRKVRRLRRNYFASLEYQRSLHAKTLLVTNIPSNLRTDEGVMRVTDEVNPTGVLPRATIGRNVKDLPDLVKNYEEAVFDLEAVLAKYLKNPDSLPTQRPTMKGPHGDKVDSIEFLTSRIRELEVQIKDVRERIDKRDAMPYGFASWDEIEQAHSVAFTVRRKRPQGTTIELAPRPNDLIWENLPLSKAARRTKRIWLNVWVTVLTLMWLPLNACIAIFLSDLSNLGQVWKGFQKQLEKNRSGWAIVQGIAAPALTSTVYLLLPIIFRRLSIRAGDITKTSREKHVVHNLYAFFVFNNLVIFSIFSALWGFIAAVIEKEHDQGVWHAINEGEFWYRFVRALYQVSPFWITWLLQRNLGAAADLSQALNMALIFFKRRFMHPTPRQYIQWTAPQPFDYASYYNYFLFYATVALCFATLQPIVLPVTAGYFALDSILKKYLLLYVFVTKTESGGQFWRILFNRVIFAAILANVAVAFSIKAHGNWIMVAAMVPAPLLMIGFKYYCVKTFDDDLQYYVRSGMRDTEGLQSGKTGKKSAEKVASRFGHPAMYKPLITPMVHSKARHLLSQVYSGRLNDENGMQNGDYAMEPMEPARPGAPNRLNAPFEIVPDSQMDFSYFKNRADFRDELGGGIYGHPDDLISERSSTPKSFMKRQWSSPGSSSRDTSPSPNRGRLRSYESKPNLADHPAFRDHSQSSGQDEIGMRGGLSTPYTEDNERLLGHQQAVPYGESMGRWDTGSTTHTGYGRVQQEPEDQGSYDYFRRGR